MKVFNLKINKALCLFCYINFISCNSIDCPSYEKLPLSVEKYEVLDSIFSSQGDNLRGNPNEIMNDCYLITGYSDTLNAKKYIDSLLLSLINPDYFLKRIYRLYFFKKSEKCNNEYTKSNPDNADINNIKDCLFIVYTFNNQYNFEVGTSMLSIRKESEEDYTKIDHVYSLIWNSTNIVNDSVTLKSKQIENIPIEERLPGLETWFDDAINLAKKRIREDGFKVKDDIRRYEIIEE